MPKQRKPEYINSEVFVHMLDELHPCSRISPTKIFLHTPNSGVIVKDGRPVTKQGNRWIYRTR